MTHLHVIVARRPNTANMTPHYEPEPIDANLVPGTVHEKDFTTLGPLEGA